MPPKRDSLEILLVEDNPGDVLLVREAFKESATPVHISVAPDGEEAIRLLFTCDGSPDPPCPDLILMDINLPKRSGHEVLQAVRADPKTQSVPVVIMSSSRSSADVERAYHLHANSYVTKPSNLEGFFKVIEVIQQFWLSTAVLPPRSGKPQGSGC